MVFTYINTGNNIWFQISFCSGISGEDGLKTGGHFNPFNTPHGCPNNNGIHSGDFGNITASSTGVATFSFDTIQISLDLFAKNCAIGRSDCS